MTSLPENAPEGKIASTNTKREIKAKVEARRRESLGLHLAAQVVRCHQDLGTKCVSFGKQANVIVEKNVLSNTLQNLQLRLPRTTSVGRARTRGRRRRRAIALGREVGVPTPRRAQTALRTKGVSLPLVQLQLA